MKNPEGWMRAPVALSLGPEDTPSGITVPGWTNRTVPGLAIHPTVRAGAMADILADRRWSITHIGSGREIACGMTERMARLRAARLEPLANWSTPALDLAGNSALFLEVCNVISGRWSGLTPRHLRRSRAEEAERKARNYLAEAVRIHENRADEINAARCRAALSHLDT